MTRKGAKDEAGNIVPGKIFKRYNPEEPVPHGILPGLDNRVDNPYLDPDAADRVRAENFEGAKKAAYKACQKEVVLAKVRGGSFAYCDADGNYYRSGFGLSY